MRAAKVHTQIRQEQIAEAALRLVAGQGMKGLSVARVARQVGVVPSAIYRHYTSKDDVLDAVLDLIHDRLTFLRRGQPSAVARQPGSWITRTSSDPPRPIWWFSGGSSVTNGTERD